jgi:hypothetical protein
MLSRAMPRHVPVASIVSEQIGRYRAGLMNLWRAQGQILHTFQRNSVALPLKFWTQK